MHLPATLCFFVTLFSLTQVNEAYPSCDITSITSPSASSLLVKWNFHQGATNYVLDVKAVNSSNTSPVSIPALASSTVEKLIQGLRPGQIYQVTFKVFVLNIVTCISSQMAQTVPAASQITESRAISSTSIRFVWSSAQGADTYFLVVNGTFHIETRNLTFTTLNGQVDNLRNNTPYSCYVFSANAAGLGARSLVKTIRTLVQPPEGMNVKELTLSTARASWFSVPGVLLYQLSVMANNKLVFPLRNITATAVNITDLQPCLTYTIGIASVNMFLEPGEPANFSYITSTIPTVSSISVEYSCATAMASISWNGVFGALWYRAVIRDGQGRSLNCTSNSTACQISMLKCGEQYSVWITAIGNCESTSDGSYVFETAPCPPKTPQLYRECSSNVILFSWSPTNSTAYYHAQAVDSDGQVTDCITMDTTCYFTDNICGKRYSFFVKSIYSGGLDCDSGYTSEVMIKTAPCLPQNIITNANCNSIGSAVTSWDLAEGASTYTVEARGNRGDFYNCTSRNTSCTLTGLDCGESLSVWIIATDGICTTDPVIGEVAETVPCAPQNVSVVGNCSSDSASLSWLSSNGAVLYIGMAKGPDGIVHICTAMATECTFQNLTCGMTYDAFVIANNMQCNSSESQHVTLQTAPCIPTLVTAALNCSSNIASITWYSALGATLYLVKMKGSQGYKTSCNNTITRCDIPNLPCGQEYSITVMGMNGDCMGPVSQSITLVSAPCPNTGIQARLDCRTNSALVSWTPGNGSVNFNATLQSLQDAQKRSCFTSGSSCNISSLQCGTRYNVSVIGYGQNCSTCSKPLVTSIALKYCASHHCNFFVPAPCVPTQVNVSLSCGTDTASVSWAASSGLVSNYIVTAEGDNGITLTCNSSSTSCNISRLACGQAYNVSVTAMSADCPGQRSEVRRVNTAPCAPQNMSANVNCSSNIATVTWGSSQGAELYSVTASSVNGLSANCTSASTSCDLSTLTCGESYTITVKAKSSNCCSGNSVPVQVQTAPCPNTGIQARLDCRTNSALVSWTPGNGSVNFNATLQSLQDAQKRSCFTSGSSCNISSLQCGTRYNVSVIGYGQNCSTCSKPLVTLDTAPCAPTQVNVSLSCGTDTASVSWAASSGLVSNYIVTAEGDNGITLTCNSSSTSCNISRLACGQAYNVSVTAMSADCPGQRSEVRRVNTAPCAPQNVSANVNCSSNIATVTWGSSQGAELYSVTASSVNGLSANCTSASTSCDLSTLTCGESYTITVKAKSSNCCSGNSAPVQVQTAPCPNTGIQARLDCRTNSALISWTPGNGSVNFNTTLQSLQDAQKRSCFTSGSSCNISSLQCGTRYNVSVIGYGQNCSTCSKPLVTLDTAPCVPTQVNVSLSCGTDTASVSWAASSGLVSNYIVTAEGDNGITLTCNSSSTSCNISRLACGQAYNVSVTAMSAGCPGQRSEVRRFNTAPCVPQNVSANVNCSSNIATVTWGSSQGAELYSVTASSVNGLSANWTSASTSCDLSTLTCGESYTITVKAKSSNCCSGNSVPVQVQTAPCPNTGIQARLDCRTNSALVSWTPGNGSVNFNTTLQSLQDAQKRSCFTSGSSCNISSLQCGTRYNVSVIGYGQNCSTCSKPLVTLDTAPCVPTQVNVSLSCGTDTASVSWAASSGLVSNYIVTAEGDNGITLTCNSSSTSCNISRLACGQAYNVSVTAMSAGCPGQRSEVRRVNTAPCAPQNVSANVNCSSNIATVTWGSSQGAELYSVTASSVNGLSANCTSASTSCDLLTLTCGESYTITVKAKSSNCCSGNSVPVQVQTAPCPNTGIQARLDCRTNSALVSWTPGNGSVNFNATLQSLQDAQKRSCFTSGSSCNISSLQCGTRYNVSVIGYGQNCSTCSKPLVTLDTAPCAPTQVNVSLSCGTDTASVSWAASSGLVSNYIVTAEGDNGITLTCNSSSTSCNISRLACGQAYNVSVTAMSAGCPGQRSEVRRVNTAPCAPQNVSANVNCSSNIATVTWGSSQGAELYSVTASSVNGLSANCTSASTSCDLSTLTCGESYTITVKAKSSNCCSGNSAPVQVQTAPCPNTGIQARLDCRTNSALVSWTPGNGSVNFNATLQSLQDAQKRSCFTSGSSCNISSLQCGTRYNVSVIGYGQNCSTCSKPLVTLDTAPCVPTQVNVSLSCGTDTASVSWAASSGLVLNYIVTAEGDNGITLTCNSSSTSCNISRLACGQAYNVSVTAMSAGCPGQRSEVRRVNAAPCAPQNVSANVNCSSNIATVTWGSSQGAELYSVTASSVNGLSANCTSASTSCDLSTLTCGESYTITVKAKSSNCCSGNSVPVQVQTAPCPNTGIQARLDCRTNSALVSWTPGNGSVNFNATLQSLQDAQKRSCFTSGSSCNISSLQCGTRYNVSVIGYGQNCSTCSKPLVTLDTAPCVPTQVNVSLSCGTDTASVSWAASSGLVSNYIVTAEGDNGITLTCNSSSTSCNISRLACGQAYNVSVTAMSTGCPGQRSEVRRVNTAPCAPQNVSANVNCSSNIATVTWGSSQGAELYSVTASSVNGLSANCTSASTSCDLSTLTCGESYTITVKAKSSNCYSGNSAPVQVQTAPCPNTGIQARLDCRTNSALVSWTPGNGSVNFNATLQSLQDAQKRSCFTSGSSCNISSLQCGTRYNVSVIGYGQNCSTCSKPLVTVDTAPCVPTQVNVSLSCGTDTASVSWAASSGLVSNYIVTAEGDNGITLTCNSSSTSCNISRLACGQAYNVSVTAMSAGCPGQRSEVRRVNTAPCAPQNVSANVNCSSNIATVTWGSSQGAELYSVTASSVNGLSANCTSASTSCDLSTLTCGESYTITVKAKSSNCCSGNSAPVQVQTAPCPNTGIQARLDCRTNSALVSWTPGNGSVNFNATLQSLQDAQKRSCFTSGSSCNISSLQCGTRYNVSVIGYGQNCSTCSKPLVTLDTAPCVPTQVNVSLSCGTDTASVSWAASSGLVSNYIVTAEGDNGITLTCNSSSTSCNISRLACGQAYNVSVTAMSAGCPGQRSEVRRFNTAPCAPQNVSANVNCSSNIATVTWGSSQGAELYSVTASSVNGLSANCTSASTSCDLSTLTCGESYTITVKAKSSNCCSGNSAPVQVQTAPCPNTGIQARLDCRTNSLSCGTDTASVSWAASSGLVSNYIVTAEGDNGITLTCNSSSTSCNISRLACGQAYNVSVTAMSAGCPGQRSEVRCVNTAPCAPQNVSANVNCSSNIATVTWGSSQGAELYSVTASSVNGLSANCTSASTSCDLSTLTCGESYTITVKAKSSNCCSGNSAPVQVQTAPCPNTGIQARLDCRTNSALVSWTPGNGSVNFNATLQSLQDAQKRSCFTSGSSCNISSLQCGTRYNVSVIGYGQNCSTCSKPLVTLDTAPCVPTQVNVSLSCGTDTASVSWAASSGLVSNYIVTAEGDNGITLTCNSSSTSCNISRLACGQAYNVSVTAMSAGCPGQRSEVRRVNAAPCVPQNVSANVNCSSNIATVTWGSSQGAELYSVTASSVNGLSANCTSASTSCDLSTLTCGESYTITVKAKSSNCCSGNSAPVQVQTAPCPNTGIQARLDCRTNSALVSWTPGNGSVNFNTTLQSLQDAQKRSCFTSGSSCNISSLQCGTRYNVSVIGYGQNCSTCSKPLVTLDTAPCVPTQVNVSLSCGTDTASVSWAASSGLVSNYIVTAEGDNGIALTCNSSSTSCNISRLACGQAYNVSVTAMSADCPGQRSEVRRFNTAPCVPQNVSANVNCSSNIATVTWGSSQGAELYSVTASSVNGLSANCTSASTSCDLSTLTCGESYTITVKAKSSNCCSGNSAPVQVQTAPCPNTGIQARLDCRTNSALVSWTPGNGLVNFNATLQSLQDAQKRSCFTSGSSCNISSLQCGTRYNVSVIGYGQNCSTCSKPLVTLDTAPCVPTQVNVSLSCGTDTASVSWAASSGLVSNYIVTAEGDNEITLTCNSSSTSCNISRLACGQAYNVSVTAMSAGCPGQRSEVRRFNTAPCAPQNVSANVNCSSNIATVTWGSSQGAELYSVTASSVNGLSANCTSASTSCDLSTLTCGESYTITVKAKSSNCCSGNSAPVQIQTAPCPNTGIQARLDCRTNSALVSWTPGNGSVNFNATLQSLQDAQKRSCFTSGSSCNISSLQCGTRYNVSVIGYGQNCSTCSKPLVTLDTAPCAPTQVNVSLSCGTDTASVSWAASSGLVSNYIVTAEGDNGITLTCNSSSTSCNISRLACGQAYNVSVTAMSAGCPGQRSEVRRVNAAPCPNTGIQARLDCRTNSALVSWTPGNGSVNFNATLQSLQDAQKRSCFTSGSSCNISSLQCGTRYNVSVIGYGQNCSTCSKPLVTLDTAPCVPTQVNVSLSCGTDTASVSWAASSGLVSNYIVTAEGDNGITLTCNSSSTSCNISRLACGQAYNVSVTAMSAGCPGQRSEVRRVNTALNSPQGVNGTVDCVTNSAWVSWDVVKGAESYTVLAVGDDGQNATCSSPNNTCNVPDLGCGKSYTFQVTASNAACMSPPSNSFQLETAPCALSSIVVVAECQSSVIMVQWERARRGNSLYIVTAEDQDRICISCNSSASSCNLTSVQCGKEYTIIVAASANQCSSLRSPPYKIRTAPCRPSQVQAVIDCQSKAVFVSWEPSYVAQSYLLTAVSKDGDLKTCNTSYNNCTLTDLHCSNTYNVSVLASNENCTSLPSTNVTFKTVPCEPVNVTANVQCNSTAFLSWGRSTGAVAYVGIAQSKNGTTVYCWNTEASCTLVGLVCGTVYNFTVQATDGICNSSMSKPQTRGAAPCPPAGLKVVPLSRTVANETQILRASWSTVSCPNSEYLFGLKGSIQGNSQALFDLASYWTSRTFFEMPLPCGSSYSATIKARNCAASSAESAAVNGTTVPCAPINVTLSASSAVVTWNESIFAMNYTAYLVNSSGRTKLCMTSQLQCSISNLSSGRIVVTALNAAGESEDSVPILVLARRRR
ncbi:uncharacterized protein fndc7rs1 [Pseudorasbora parva]|uniref:uncharacterized protein fndc7rs1 n=1 Tax=Pseudorasbora parva TaxID=51549 RepID=UPI00351E7A44